MTPQPKKLKYRVLISTRGELIRMDGFLDSISYFKYLTTKNTYKNAQGNQVNYFIPINE